MLVNKKELADIVSVTEKSLTTWQKNGLPIEIDGGRGAQNQYDTRAVIDWMIRREISKLTVNSDGGMHDYDEERARLTYHQANKAELEEGATRGKLIPAETVLSVWGDMVAAFRAKILSLPSKTASRMIAITKLTEAEDILKDIVFEALNELADYDPDQYNLSSYSQDAGTDETTAEADRKPVGRRGKGAK